MASAALAHDIVGDVHGCDAELVELLGRLGYGDERAGFRAPPGRQLVFVGDLIDRGPRIPEVVERVRALVRTGDAVCLLGNHEFQLLEHLQGRAPLAWGLAETLEQYEAREASDFEALLAFARELPWKLELDEGRLLVTHAGLPEDLQATDSALARRFALYGSRDGARRIDWAPDYAGTARVVYGHTPRPDPQWVQRTLCVDTGCVYGGALTALRYPELELVSVPAQRTWYGHD